MNNIEVSVIIPIYNVEKYLARCLESLVGQDFTKPFEIILVNDGSPDGSAKIAEDYAQRFDCIKLYTQENRGVSAARNNGISHANGRYITFADSDDFVEPDYISTLYDLMEKSGADISYCGFYTVKEGSDKRHSYFLSHKSGIFTSAQMLKSLFHDITVRSFSWGKMYRREIFTERNIKFPEGRHFEDVYIMPRIFLQAESIAVTKRPLYNYLLRKSGITGNITHHGIFQYIDAYGGIRGFLDEQNIFSQYKGAFRFLGLKIALTVIPWLFMAHSRDKGFALMKEIREAIRRIRKYAK